MADLQVEDHGSIVLLRPLTDAGEQFIEERLDNEEAQYWGNAIAVEPRYVGDIVQGAQGDGLEVVI